MKGDMMKRFLTLALLCLAALALATTSALAQDAPKAKKKGGKKAGPTLRVLVTYGGHGFKEKQFWAMWDALPGIKYDKAKLPDQMELLKPGLEKNFDVLVMYDQVKNLTPEQQKNFQALVEGGIGLVSLHHNIGANTGWDEFGKIIGAFWIRGPKTIDGQQFTKSASADGQTFQIKIADPDHFITKGLKDFEIVDESYDKYYMDPRVHVLLTTEHPKNAKAIAWITSYGKSPVYFLQLGHDDKAYEHPSFRQLIVRGIRWAASEAKKMRQQPAAPVAK